MSISSKISKWVLELQEYEYTFIVEDITMASLADVLTYKVKEKKITPKAQVKLDFSPQGELEDAYTLLFDGAYRRQRNKAAGGFVILNEEKKEVLKKGIQLHLAHSNNEAEFLLPIVLNQAQTIFDHKLCIAECLVGDETGVINFTARNKKVNMTKPGATIILQNARINMYKSCMKLAVEVGTD
ncbi:hypothetical protein L7F22_047282 [Adiantum nelumboides]|nr:hypothetical protein [Adiantum nelumboides]